jgi:hypothetical protein
MAVARARKRPAGYIKLDAQYDTWYPTDCPDGAPILISMPPDVGM